MKLLFDENISFRIIRILNNHFPGSAQLRNISLEGATDLKIWQFAKLNDYIIVTFYADFYDISHLRGHPPKIIWLRTGNTHTLYLANLLIQKAGLINSFLEDEEISCLELY